jgi:cytochrome b561
MKYDRITRWLHLGLALTIAAQLFSSLLMDAPEPGKVQSQTERLFFLIHERSGMAVLALLAGHWLWGMAGHVSEGWGHLFPWFSRERLRRLGSDLRKVPEWFSQKFPSQESETIPLTGAVHGLGLLAATAMGLTGITIFLGMAPDGSAGIFVEAVKETHEFFAIFVWAYFLGHVGMALFHHRLGHRTLADMFNLVGKVGK